MKFSYKNIQESVVTNATFTKRNVHRGALALLVGFALLIGTTDKAFADRYECTAKAEVIWKNALLKPSHIDSKTVVRFDDETGALWIGTRPQPMQLTLIQKLHPDNALVAMRQDTSGDDTETVILQLRHENNNSDLYFLFYSDGRTTSGNCQIAYQDKG